MTKSPNVFMTTGSVAHDGSGNRARKGKVRDRLHHKVGRSHQNVVERCKGLLEIIASEKPSFDLVIANGWRDVEKLVRPDLLPAVRLVIPVLASRGLQPTDLNDALVNNLIEDCEIFARTTELDAHNSCERWIRSVFIQFVDAIRILRIRSPNLIPIALNAVKSHHTIIHDNIRSLPESIHILLNPCHQKLISDMSQPHTAKRYHSVLLQYCYLLIKSGHSINSLSDLFSVEALNIQISDWSRRKIQPVTRLSILYVLRWLSTEFLNDLEARERIDSLVSFERSNPQLNDNCIDAIKLVRYARDDEYRRLFNNFHELIISGGPNPQNRTRISLASGGLLCLLSLVGLMEPQDMGVLVFDAPDPDDPQHILLDCKSGIQDASLNRTLDNFGLTDAIVAFYNLFTELNGRPPISLLDGFGHERCWKSSIPRRMSHCLEHVAPDLTASELRQVTIAHMISKNIPAPTIARSAGYASFTRFLNRFRPVMELVEISRRSI